MAFFRNRRIAALWFPYLATDRVKRHKPAPDAPPLVVVEKQENALRLQAIDRKAAALGLQVGQPLANARAMLPALEVVEADRPGDLKLLSLIADWCSRFSPFVALDGSDGLMLDVTGVSHLFGGEEAMLDEMRGGLRGLGFPAQGAIAGTAAAAKASARYLDGEVVAAGDEAQAIAPLPVEALGLDPLITHAFRRAGLKKVGQAASRKRSEIASRFGAATIAILDEALGRVGRPLSPRLPAPQYSVAKNFAEPIMTEDTARQVLDELAGKLGRMLERQGEGARHMEASFFRSDGTVSLVAIEMGEPTRERAVIGRLFAEKLQALADPLDPGFGFDRIGLSASRTERLRQGSTDLQTGQDSEKEIRFLIDRLAARFGNHRILVFRPNGTHIPEAAWETVPAQYAREVTLAWKPLRRDGEAPLRPLRQFARPEPVNFLGAVPGQPLLQWRRMGRRIVRCEGPERIAMEWWHDRRQGPTRDYFRIEDDAGRRYWLYRSGESWRLHGMFA